MKNLKAQATILAVIFIAVVSIATGYLYLQNRDLKSQLVSNNGADNTPIPPKPEVTPAQPSVVPIDETADWNLFQNQFFSFKYPKSWNLEKSGSSLSTSRPTKRIAGGDYTPGMGWLFFELSKDSPQKVISSTVEATRKDEVIINGYPATRLSGYSGVAGSVYFVTVVFNKDGKALWFSLSTQDTDLEKPLTSEFDQILSTFRFLDSTGSSEPVNFYSFSGQLVLNGYLSTLERNCAFIEDGSCKVKLAVFTVLKADNPQFNSFLKDLAGNAFATGDGIILGCIDASLKKINSSNDADTGTVENLISGGQYDLLVGSSPSHPINLSLEKPKLTGGRGAPDCYSHFRNFKIY